MRHGDCDGPGEGTGVGVGHGTLAPLTPIKQPLCAGPGENDAVGDGHGTGELPPVAVKQPGDALGDARGDGVGHGVAWPATPTRQPLWVGPGENDAVGDGHGTGELPPVAVKQPGDGLVDGRAVGDGHGLAPFPVETRQGALGDGAGVGVGVGVEQGATVPPLPTRHEGDGLGCAIAAPLSPL